ncbi:hydroxymethylglutaryl-CoA reductase, degradative [Lentibacillus sp. N15]|uniref:hydroxymethylglutaryl-CoA reductase, degradative n=1 Tax=Lentibacillus songyuanensis TaxID=3136161 RepID=UPI0031BAD61A
MPVSNSRLEGFYKKTITERLNNIADLTSIDNSELEKLESGNGLSSEKADRMIENVVGKFNLPLGIATNFVINNKDYIIPMAVEEPSVVAAASNMGKLTREHGGFTTSYSGSLMMAQIHVTDIKDAFGARLAVYQHKEELLQKANEFDKTLVSLGGGAKDLEIRVLEDTKMGQVLTIHLIVDVLDAMGANTINTMAEKLAPRIEQITKGNVILRIITNLADRRLARASVTVPAKALEMDGFSGDEVADGIVRAYQIADADPYRAATHNKGIMNGIDPVVVATGNDWRAIEAGAHAYAARNGRYRSMTTWERNVSGDLVGTLELPMAVGIVGGATKTHPMAQLSLQILGIDSAQDLAEIIVAVGLAQNMAGLKVLATEGVQRGHMELHARNIAEQAGVPADVVEWVISEMVSKKDVRTDKAKELIQEWNKQNN